MKGEPTDTLTLRPATTADIAMIEHLMLHNFPHVLQATMGNCADEIKHQVLIGLRQSRKEPVAGIFLATDPTNTPIATIAYETSETATGFQFNRLAALRPLGWLPMLRFLLLARLTLISHTPQAGDVYFRTLAVDPAYRRQGLGHRLFRYAEQMAATAGHKRATCFVASNNSASRSLLDKLQYRPIYTRQTFWRERLLGEPSLIYLEKSL